MTDTTKKTAGAFDIRNIIGALLGIYGVILLLMGLFGDPDPASPDAPPVGATSTPTCGPGSRCSRLPAIFLVWSRLRPIVVPEDVDKDMKRPDVGH